MIDYYINPNVIRSENVISYLFAAVIFIFQLYQNKNDVAKCKVLLRWARWQASGPVEYFWIFEKHAQSFVILYKTDHLENSTAIRYSRHIVTVNVSKWVVPICSTKMATKVHLKDDQKRRSREQRELPEWQRGKNNSSYSHIFRADKSPMCNQILLKKVSRYQDPPEIPD